MAIKYPGLRFMLSGMREHRQAVYDALRNLDRYEGAPEHYRRIEVTATNRDGKKIAAQAYIADVTAPKDRARAFGLIGAAFGLGFIFGPALGGVLSHLGPSAPMWSAR